MVEIEFRTNIEVARVGHLDAGGNRRLAVVRHAQLGGLHEQRQRQQMGHNRQGIDARIEDAQATGLPDPGLAGVPLAHVFFPVDLHALQGTAGQPVTGSFDAWRVA
ncbi:hypothetical protein D3C85_1602690 [compost metagenome]